MFKTIHNFTNLSIFINSLLTKRACNLALIPSLQMSGQATFIGGCADTLCCRSFYLVIAILASSRA